MYAGNTVYFDYRLTAYRNNMELLNMLRDALKLLNNHEIEISFRKKDATFLDIAEVDGWTKRSRRSLLRWKPNKLNYHNSGSFHNKLFAKKNISG